MKLKERLDIMKKIHDENNKNEKEWLDKMENDKTDMEAMPMGLDSVGENNNKR